MSDVELRPIEVEILGKTWPVIQPQLNRIFKKSHGRLDNASTFKRLFDGELFLWVAYEPETDSILGIIGASIGFLPSGIKHLNIEFIDGKDRNKWVYLVALIKGWGSQRGCKKVSMTCPKGLAYAFPEMTFNSFILEEDL